jgi:hypothetical protein
MSGWRRAAIVGLVLLVCAVVDTTADAATGGGHLPGFSLMDRRVAVAKLPQSVGLFFGGIPGRGAPGRPTRATARSGSAKSNGRRGRSTRPGTGDGCV